MKKHKADTIQMNEDAMDNIYELRLYRKKRGISQRELSKMSGISLSSIHRYETGQTLPTIEAYDKLGYIFGWHEVLESPSSRPRKKITDVTEEIKYLKPVKLPGLVEFTFEEGHSYSIENGKGDPATDCIFSYEGKQGIHHMFREVRGKWTRTYTDAQLVGKHIKEVDENGNFLA